MCVTSLKTGAPECTNHTETELWSAWGQLAAGGVRDIKDRDTPALKVRAGTPGVGCISRDAAGLSSTNRNRVKVARTSVENGPQSLRSEEAEFRLLLLWLSEEARKSHQRTKAWKYCSQGAHPHPPYRGHIDSTQTGFPEYW